MKGINFKRTKDCNKIEYLKCKLDGTSIYIKPATFGNVDITEFRTGINGGDFDTISITIKDEDKFKKVFQPGEFLTIVPYHEHNDKYHEMCWFYVGYKEDAAEMVEVEFDELYESGNYFYGIKGDVWCYQF